MARTTKSNKDMTVAKVAPLKKSPLDGMQVQEPKKKPVVRRKPKAHDEPSISRLICENPKCGKYFGRTVQICPACGTPRTPKDTVEPTSEIGKAIAKIRTLQAFAKKHGGTKKCCKMLEEIKAEIEQHGSIDELILAIKETAKM